MIKHENIIIIIIIEIMVNNNNNNDDLYSAVTQLRPKERALYTSSKTNGSAIGRLKAETSLGRQRRL